MTAQNTALIDGKEFTRNTLTGIWEPGASTSKPVVEVQRHEDKGIPSQVMHAPAGLRMSPNPEAEAQLWRRVRVLLAILGITIGVYITMALLPAESSGGPASSISTDQSPSNTAPLGQTEAPGATGQVPAASGPTVTLASLTEISGPSIVVPDASLGVGEIVAIPLTFFDMSNGLSGFDMLITLEDGAVAEIVDVTFPAYGLTDVRYLAPNQLHIRAVDLGDIATTEQNLADLTTIELLGKQPGTTQITVTLNALDDDDGQAIDPMVYNGLVRVE